MSELISGKEAKLAWANGEELEYTSESMEDWIDLNHQNTLGIFDRPDFKFRLKPRTIYLNGIEVPEPFKPKDKDVIFYISDDSKGGFHESIWNKRWIEYPAVLGVWRTEEEIKQVVAALRSVFGKK